jgi:uncharacterized membrane protein
VISQAPGVGRRIPKRLAAATAAALAAGFALVYLIHVLLLQEAGGSLALLIAVAWTLACAVMTSLGSRHRMVGLLLTALALVMVACYWDWLQARVDVVYLIQHAGSHALLGVWFGGSLFAGRSGGQPLITQLATRLHGPLPPAIARYTARVTGVWTAYFLLMALASCLLFAFGSIRAWSILANLVTLPLVVAIFIVEYLVRLRLHPDFEHVSILEGVRAFMR